MVSVTSALCEHLAAVRATCGPTIRARLLGGILARFLMRVIGLATSSWSIEAACGTASKRIRERLLTTALKCLMLALDDKVLPLALGIFLLLSE